MVYHTLFGKTGVFAFFEMDKEIQSKEEILTKLSAEREVLETKVKLLKLYDTDYIDELARYLLGLADPEEKVIMIIPKED